MKIILPALILLGVALGALEADASVSHTYEVEGWRVRIRQDQFSGAVDCEIMRRNVSFQHGQAVFQFDPKIDTSRAAYRIDNGPPESARMPDADRLTDDVHRLENPSHGEVKLSLERLAFAHEVSIRPSSARNAARFDVSGLGDAVAFASVRRCPVH